MKVGDFVRSKTNDYYGVIVEVLDDSARVIWQGIACDTSWEPSHNLVFGVENELMVWSGN